ncbi:MAG: hypothetical protein AAFX00_08505, partial [Pseudomonadota bacterium]
MTVRRRHVFYIPGYDPFPPRRYRELYRTEAAEQGRISGDTYRVEGMGGERWRVHAFSEGADVEAVVEVLIWSDLVRDSMQSGVLATYGQLVTTAWLYLRTGALWRLSRLRAGPVLAMLYPSVGLLVQLCFALLVGGAAVVWLPFPVWATWAMGLGAAVALLELCRRRDRRFFIYYLMHDYAHSASAGGAYPPDVEARLDAFAARIAAARATDVDEVLVVGHSSGAHMAVSALARVP